MRCTSPGNIRNRHSGEWVTHPCGQCLPCRIKKKSSWTLRNLLEHQVSQSSSFWTLTLDNSGIGSFLTSGPRKLITRFSDALRKSERRAGNLTPIRFYGCMEYGGKFGRPHYHMLLYNVAKNLRPVLPYTPSQPRTLFSTGLWPHGHVDYAEFNPKSVNYVISYITAFHAEKHLQPVPFRTIRPGIGYYGLAALGAHLAHKHGELAEMPVSLSFNNRWYPLDRWSQQTLVWYYRKAGGRFTDQLNDREKRYLQLIEDEYRRTNPEIDRAEKRRVQNLEVSYGKKEKENLQTRILGFEIVKREALQDVQNRETDWNNDFQQDENEWLS